jgi:hypothetical protein
MFQRVVSLFHTAKGNYLITDPGEVVRPTRLQVTIWSLLVIISLIISLGNYQAYQLGLHFDDASYVILARSFLYSDQYGMINSPGQPSPAKYPFGYPLLLVPFIMAFPNNLDVLKILSLLATILNAAILFWGWRSFGLNKSYWWGVAIAGMYVLSPLTIDHTRRVMSEPVFTTFCLLAIILAEQAVRGRPSRWWSTFMSLALMFAVYTRSIGLILVGSIFAYLLIRKGIGFIKEVAFILLQMSFLVGLVVWLTPVQLKDLVPTEYLKDPNADIINAPLVMVGENNSVSNSISSTNNHPSLATNLGQIIDKLHSLFVYGINQHFGKNVRFLAIPIGGGEKEQNFANNIGMSGLPMILGYLVSGLVVFGIVRSLIQEGITQFLLFAILYYGAIFFWWWDDMRLLYPVLPQIHFGLLCGAEWFIFRLTRIFSPRIFSLRIKNNLLISMVCILFIMAAYNSYKIDDSRLHAGDLRVRSNWIRLNTETSDIVMTEAPVIDYLYSGIKTVPYPSSFSSSSQIEEYLIQNQIKYILIAPMIEWQTSYHPEYSDTTLNILPLIMELSSKGRLKQVHSSKEDLIKVYQFNP